MKLYTEIQTFTIYNEDFSSRSVERKVLFKDGTVDRITILYKDEKTKREIVIKQIELQEAIQSAGINVVYCGNCGTVLFHERNNEEIDCFCGHTMALSDCPDLYYPGIENNAEFQ
jgi:hypothetical protein